MTSSPTSLIEQVCLVTDCKTARSNFYNTIIVGERRLYTLILIGDNEKVLLGLKKRGLGVGKWNGFGGKVEPGETIEEGAIREVKEECDLTVKNLKKTGILEFIFEDEPNVLQVHVFKTSDYSGEVTESEEMQPQWFSTSEIPYSEMWEDDMFWFPLYLQNRCFKGFFCYSKHETIEHHKLQIVKSLDPEYLKSKQEDGSSDEDWMDVHMPSKHDAAETFEFKKLDTEDECSTDDEMLDKELLDIFDKMFVEKKKALSVELDGGNGNEDKNERKCPPENDGKYSAAVPSENITNGTQISSSCFCNVGENIEEKINDSHHAQDISTDLKNHWKNEIKEESLVITRIRNSKDRTEVHVECESNVSKSIDSLSRLSCDPTNNTKENCTNICEDQITQENYSTDFSIEKRNEKVISKEENHSTDFRIEKRNEKVIISKEENHSTDFSVKKRNEEVLSKEVNSENSDSSFGKDKNEICSKPVVELRTKILEEISKVENRSENCDEEDDLNRNRILECVNDENAKIGAELNSVNVITSEMMDKASEIHCIEEVFAQIKQNDIRIDNCIMEQDKNGSDYNEANIKIQDTEVPESINCNGNVVSTCDATESCNEYAVKNKENHGTITEIVECKNSIKKQENNTVITEKSVVTGEDQCSIRRSVRIVAKQNEVDVEEINRHGGNESEIETKRTAKVSRGIKPFAEVNSELRTQLRGKKRTAEQVIVEAHKKVRRRMRQ